MKKVLSLVLALAMIIGMVPVTFAAETGEQSVRQSYHYVFNSAAHGGSGNIDMNVTSGNYTNVHTYEKTTLDISDPWEFVAMNAPYNYSQLKTADKRMEIVLSHPKNADESIGTLVFNPDNISAEVPPAGVCLKIKIDKPGTYRPIIEYLPDDNGVITEIYLTKTVVEPAKETGVQIGKLGEALKKIPQSDRIGVVDSYGAYEATTYDTVKPQALKNVTVNEGGDYYLIFVYNGKNAAVKNERAGMFYPVRLILDEVSGLESQDNSYDYRFTAGEGVKLQEGAYASDANAVPVVNSYAKPGYVAAGVNKIPHFTNAEPKTDNYTTYLNGNYIDTTKSAVWAFGERYREYNNGSSANLEQTGLQYNLEQKKNPYNPSYVAFKLTVPEKGRYYLSLDPEHSIDDTLGGAFEISFFPAKGITSSVLASNNLTNADISTANYVENAQISAAAAKNRISDYDFDDDNPYALTEGYITISTVDVSESGEYYLVFTNKEKNAHKNYSQMKIKAVKLDSVKIADDPDFVNVVLDFQTNPIPSMRKTNTTLSFERADGNPDIGSYSVRYESADPNVAKVDESTGEITAVSEGTVLIKAYITTLTGTYMGEKLLAVTPKPVLSAITFNLENSKLLVGQTKYAVPDKAVMDDGEPIDVGNYSYKYSTSDESVAQVTGDGLITAVSVGEAVITVSTANEKDEPITAQKKITVLSEMEKVVVDFTKTVAKSDYSVPTETPGYEIISDESTNRVHEKRMAGTRSLLSVLTGRSSVTWPASSNNTTFAISVDVPVEGDYQVSLVGGLSLGGAMFSIFVDDTFVGDHSCRSEEAGTWVVDKERFYNTIHLTEGKHKIYFRMRKTIYVDGYLYLDTLTLTPKNGTNILSEINVEIPDEIAVGEVIEGNVSAIMTDETVHIFGIDKDGKYDAGNTITSESSAQDVISLNELSPNEFGTNGVYPYRMKALTTGNAEVGFKATFDGKTIDNVKRITVIEDTIASTTAKVDAKEVFVDDEVKLIPEPRFEKSGRIINSASSTTVFTSETGDIATVEGNILTALAPGKAKIKVESTFRGETVSSYIYVDVFPEGMTSAVATAGGSPRIRFTGAEDETFPLYVQPISNKGNLLDREVATVTATALTPEIATLDGNLNITPIKIGDARFSYTIVHNGRSFSGEVTLPVVEGKTKSTYMTAEKAVNARENAEKYDWAKSQVKGYIEKAEKHVANLESLYEHIISEGLPRGMDTGSFGDPEIETCRYCRVDLRNKHGRYAWIMDPVTRPWKVQCPDCKRLFPSNDFESFYKLGLNEYGEFDQLRALEAHREMLLKQGKIDTSITSPGEKNTTSWYAYYGYGVKGGYLYNEMYEDLENVKNPANPKEPFLRPGETTERWGVEDGWGYIPNDENGNPYMITDTFMERHAYISYYIHWLYYYHSTPSQGFVYNAINDCAKAYFYTGEKKYGRVAAILLDRLADFYPGYNLNQHCPVFYNSQGGLQRGKIVGCIWESTMLIDYITDYDMVYDMYDDPEVLKYIAEKRKTTKMHYSKENASQIRANIEDGLIRTALSGLVDKSVEGNFGFPQKMNAVAAVVLDSMPESKEWIDYLMATGWDADPATGGSINEVLIDTICHDGQGDEASSYNVNWLGYISDVNDVLLGYEKYQSADMFNHPKFVKMFYANLPLMVSYFSPAIGDTGNTAIAQHWIRLRYYIKAFSETGDPIFAQAAYEVNGNSTAGLYYDITVKDPERLADEVQEIIDTYGTLKYKSELMSGFGFAALKDGHIYQGTSQTEENTRRAAWMYFGTANKHGHADALNLGMVAFGVNLMPDLGYPEMTSSQPNRVQWVDTTISHNTVLVDEVQQSVNDEPRGKTMHFDAEDNVQVMDVDTSYVYPTKADAYRRSVVYIKVDDANSYAVDFFRVLGGDVHTYSMHTQSNAVAETTGLELVPQTDENGNYIGSYAGEDVPFGEDPLSDWNDTSKLQYPRGYTWFKNVDRDASPENKFEVDFAIKDYRNMIKNNKNIHLRMMVLNESNIKEGISADVAIADGLPPQTAANKPVEKLKYVLLRHSGENLDTVFTTVLEPYRSERYLTSSDELEMNITAGTENEGDVHRAVKVTHKNGRVDYILYATNNTVTYEIELDGGEKLAFRGFVGVYTLQNGENTYSYINDGDILGTQAFAKPAITGTVKSFTKALEFENEIVITPDLDVSDAELADLLGRVVHVDNGELARNASYRIEKAEKNGTDIKLRLGNTTLIRKYVDKYDFSRGYVFNIAEGQNAKIPMSYSEDYDPVFADMPDAYSTSAGSTIKVSVKAQSRADDDKTITYIGTSLPRGASINSATGEISWKPDASQVGKNNFAVTARDAYGRESTVWFVVEVYGSTTGSSSSDKTETPETGTTDTPAGGGGGGGGGGGAAPTPDTETTPDDTENTDEKDNVQNGGESAPDASGETDSIRFTDLSNHAWAADAINELAADGIIKGTSGGTFSPANNITRADFALLLVRAFKLESDNTENFADVSASDYFASELAIARNNGIISGIGDNKFAPRNTITRQDMMVIVYRALQKSGVEFDIYDEPQYPDYDTVSDYAEKAVSALISAGLVNGKNGRIAPTDYTTRAEVAVLIKRILDYIK